MLLKRLYEDQDLSIERILSREQKRLKLSSQQLVVLLAFFAMYRRRTYSLNSLSKRVDITQSELANVIDNLIEQNFLSFNLETKDGKVREVFSLEGTFLKIEQLYQSDFLELKKGQTESLVSKTVLLFEQGIGKSLSSYELEAIRRWYEENVYGHEDIVKAINDATISGRLSVKYIERTLNKQKIATQPIDDKADQVIDEIFKAMK